MTSITRHFADVGGREVHYRRAGSGPAVVLLHPAPLSSRIFDPLIEELAGSCTVFALDRAGFGLSELLDHPRPEIGDYADALRDELDAIGIDTAFFYGSATGSVVGTEFARRYPERVESIVLENLPLVTDEQAAYMIEHYAPRFEPLWEGGHLPYLWTVAHDIACYWPWSRREVAARRDVDMPFLDDIRLTFLDLLLIGPEGHLAYDAVWRYRPAPALRELTVPTTILCLHADDPDPHEGFRFLEEAYRATDPEYSGRVTVPVLWDVEQRRIVNNESSEIIRMLDAWSDEGPALYPERLRAEIDEVNERVYHGVNDGVYRAGFATTQAAYEEAFDALFATLDWLEERLARRRYLVGDALTEADVRLFVTLVRFDAVYVGHFKCNLRRIDDYPALSAYLRDLYQHPGVAATVSFDHIKRHYYSTHPALNLRGIVPKGPELDLLAPHGRDAL